MIEEPEIPRRRSILPWSLAVAVLPFIVLFGPLAIAYVEYNFLGTSLVEDWFMEVGLHDQMSRIYDPIIDLLNLD